MSVFATSSVTDALWVAKGLTCKAVRMRFNKDVFQQQCVSINVICLSERGEPEVAGG